MTAMFAGLHCENPLKVAIPSNPIKIRFIESIIPNALFNSVAIKHNP